MDRAAASIVVTYWLCDAVAPGNLRLGSSLVTLGLSWRTAIGINRPRPLHRRGADNTERDHRRSITHPVYDPEPGGLRILLFVLRRVRAHAGRVLLVRD